MFHQKVVDIMKQLMIILSVIDKEGKELFCKENCTPQDVLAAINLFAKDGVEIKCNIVEFELDKVS